MQIEKLTLNNYRNIKDLTIEFSNHVNILYGNNGQGKTNIVEAIYLLSYANSFRTNNHEEMINNDSDEAIVTGIVAKEKTKRSYKVKLKKENKTVYIENKLVNRFSDFVGNELVVSFVPDDVSIFKESPGVRRNFLDKELSNLFPLYIKQLISYKKILEGRNALLKHHKVDESLLDVITNKLVDVSYSVYKRRKWLILKLCKYASIIYQELTNNQKEVAISYKSFIDDDDYESYKSKALKIYEDSKEKDIEKTYTIQGIHKDDFKVYLDKLEIDAYASQGQQRLVALCLKLAMGEIIFHESKELPIIILDDAFSELDSNHKDKLLKYILFKNQVFITCTNYKDIINAKVNEKVLLLKIDNGKLIERSSI